MWDGVRVSGRVVWARHTERGVELDADSRTLLADYVRTLAEQRRGRDTGEFRR